MTAIDETAPFGGAVFFWSFEENCLGGRLSAFLAVSCRLLVGAECGLRSVLLMADFKKLEVWQRAHAMAIETHRVAGRMRGSVHSSLRNQLVRAAMSVPANIVEGREQKSEGDFRRFLGYSVASLTEVEYHLMMGHDIGAIQKADYRSLLAQTKTIRKMIHGLIKRLKPAADSQKSR